MANKDQTDTVRMEKIVSLCKRRGFIFQSAELYGGLNGCWDYGPLGAELKRNLKDYWWRKNVQERDDILGLDGSILTHQAVLTASGHIGGFSDPMCDCLLTKARLRADQIDPQSGTAYHFTGASHEQSGWSVDRPYSVLLNQPNQDENKARKTAKAFYAQFLNDNQISPKKLTLIGETTSEETDVTNYNPDNGSLLTEPRDFELMFKTQMGASADENDPNATAYLRPETAQSIFVQYKNVVDSNRVKLPFGVAQIGKAFRNEINPRNFTFRSREFEQMEIEYFCKPEDGLKLTDTWLANRLAFYEEIGLDKKSSMSSIFPMASVRITRRRLTTSNTTSPSVSKSSRVSLTVVTTISVSTRSTLASRWSTSTRRPKRSSSHTWWNRPPVATAPSSP